jgi:hypothetical protein
MRRGRKPKTTPDGIRTHNLCLRRATLYPIELQAHMSPIVAKEAVSTQEHFLKKGYIFSWKESFFVKVFIKVRILPFVGP